MYKYCDCRDSKGQLRLSQSNLGRGKMQLTTTCKNDLCIYCGNFAVINRNELTNKKQVRKESRDRKYSFVEIRKYAINQEDRYAKI